MEIDTQTEAEMAGQAEFGNEWSDIASAWKLQPEYVPASGSTAVTMLVGLATVAMAVFVMGPILGEAQNLFDWQLARAAIG